MSNDSKMVRRFERMDFAASDLAKPQTTADGFWRLEGKVARTGIQVYQDGAGGVRRELRLEGDVKASLPGFALAPLTNGHPPQLVTPSNAQQYAAGAIGEASYSDGWVKAPLTVWTKDAIESIRAGRAQLSVGYQCRLIDEPGTYQGEKYDCRQEDIIVNHVALVDAARAGSEARLRLDATDACSASFFDSAENRVESPQALTRTAAQESTLMAHKMKLDGLEIEVADANAASIIERAISAAKADGDKRADLVTVELATVKQALSAAQAKADALESASKVDVKCDECDGSGKVFGKECDGCGGKGEMKADALTFDARKASRARSDARAAAVAGEVRAKLLVVAGQHLSANEKLDGKTDTEIKKLVLTKLDKSVVFDGRDDTYVDHRFEFAMEKLDGNKIKPIDRARAVIGETPVAAEHVDAKPEMDAKAKAQSHYDSMYFKKNRGAK